MQDVLPVPNDSVAALSLAERSSAYVGQLLLDGGLEPGDPIPIDAIAQQLGVSRQPVVQAVRQFASNGFIMVRAQAGSWVATPTASEIADFYGLFAPAEAYMASLAAERRSQAEAEQFEKLASAIEYDSRSGGAPASRDPLYRSLNRRFHDEVHRMARSPRVSATVSAMWDRSDFYIRTAFGSLFFDPETHVAHRAIAAAILKGRPASARKTTEEHLARVGRGVTERLTSRGETKTHQESSALRQRSRSRR